MGRPTGPGKFSEFDWVDSDLVLTANLYNYDIDGDELKPEHKKFLRERIAEYLIKYGYHVWLHGHTSRSGDYAYNVGLSKRRAEGVGAYLKSLGTPDAQIQMEWDGPRSATPKVLEAEIDRSVSFHVQPGLTPRAPRVPPHPSRHGRFPDPDSGLSGQRSPQYRSGVLLSDLGFPEQPGGILHHPRGLPALGSLLEPTGRHALQGALESVPCHDAVPGDLLCGADADGPAFHCKISRAAACGGDVTLAVLFPKRRDRLARKLDGGRGHRPVRAVGRGDVGYAPDPEGCRKIHRTVRKRAEGDGDGIDVELWAGTNLSNTLIPSFLLDARRV